MGSTGSPGAFCILAFWYGEPYLPLCRVIRFRGFKGFRGFMIGFCFCELVVFMKEECTKRSRSHPTAATKEFRLLFQGLGFGV